MPHRVRFAAVLVALVGWPCAPASAADLGGAGAGGAWSGGGEVYCGSDMITIYDSQPGVVTRRWRTNCKACDPATPAYGFRRAAATYVFPPYPPFMEPWRR